ncbi:ATP-binding cassette domain-containing protein [Spirillospora sp. CA-255316]
MRFHLPLQHERTLSRHQVARRTALVAQDSAPDFDFTVEEVVAMGRGPWLRPFATITGALERVGLAHHRTRRLSPLSGGQRQRARALARESPLLLLDEPTNTSACTPRSNCSSSSGTWGT